jgi:periplasmic divalent cation tolerance protein
MTTDYQIVFNTCPDAATARTIATALVERGLAACVNIVPGVESVYQWKGQIENSSELLLIIKTRSECYAALEQAIQALHPYELPEIIALPLAAGLPAYLEWIDSSLKQEKLQ